MSAALNPRWESREKPVWENVVSGIPSVFSRKPFPRTCEVKENAVENALASDAFIFSIAVSVNPFCRKASEETPGAPSREPWPRQYRTMSSICSSV